MPFLSGLWAKIAAVGAIVLAVIAAAAKLVSMGKASQREHDQRRVLGDIEAANSARRSVGDAYRNDAVPDGVRKFYTDK